MTTSLRASSLLQQSAGHGGIRRPSVAVWKLTARHQQHQLRRRRGPLPPIRSTSQLPLQLKSSRRVSPYLQRCTLPTNQVRRQQGKLLLVRSSASSPSNEEEKETSTSTSRAAVFTALALVLPAILTAQASAAATKKKARAPKAVPTMQLDERREWAKGLPKVEEAIPYTELVELREADRVKHIIKHPNSKLKERPERVYVVMKDDRVLRCVLPTPERDEKFWSNWEYLELNTLLIDAFSPAVPAPKVEGWAARGPSLTFLYKIQEWLKPKDRKKTAASSRLEELARTRREMEQELREQEEEARRFEAQRVRELREQKALEKAAREEQERLQRREEKWAREAESRELKMQQQAQDNADWRNFFYSASRNEGFRFLMGVFFFWLFHQTVVVGVKKRKQDYEDRLKIEQAEEEERRKMCEWEGAMEAAKALSTSEEWGKEGMSEEEKKRLEEVENNPQLKMGMKFMKSGEDVQEASPSNGGRLCKASWF